MTRAKGKHQRQCSTCRKMKPLDQFYASSDPRDPDGHLRSCKSCSKGRANITNKALRILRDRHRDEYLEIRQSLRNGPIPGQLTLDEDVMHTTTKETE